MNERLAFHLKNKYVIISCIATTLAIILLIAGIGAAIATWAAASHFSIYSGMEKHSDCIPSACMIVGNVMQYNITKDTVTVTVTSNDLTIDPCNSTYVDCFYNMRNLAKTLWNSNSKKDASYTTVAAYIILGFAFAIIPMCVLLVDGLTIFWCYKRKLVGDETELISSGARDDSVSNQNSSVYKNNKEIECVFAKDQETWRRWLEENTTTKDSIWLVYHKKHTGKETIVYEQALDEALCFGWIDSTSKPYKSDPDNSYMQYFCKRKEKSQWSKKNKDRVAELIEEGKMTKHGLAVINKAKENGMWDLMNDVYDLIIPQDLKDAFSEHDEEVFEFFENLSKSVKQNALGWLFQAKRAETREKRIKHIVEKCKDNEKPWSY